MKQFWTLWEGELKDEEIAYIIEHCEKFPAQEGRVFPDSPDGEAQVKRDIRRSEIRFINDEYCGGLMWEYVKRANASHYGFDIDEGFVMQYTAYHGSDKGHYDWHQDSDMITDEYEDRKLSIVIQLTDPKKYKGGDFQFDLNGDIVTIPEFRKKGSILVFPSFLKHRVQNVTKGTRNSLVSWIKGPNFK